MAKMKRRTPLERLVLNFMLGREGKAGNAHSTGTSLYYAAPLRNARRVRPYETFEVARHIGKNIILTNDDLATHVPSRSYNICKLEKHIANLAVEYGWRGMVISYAPHEWHDYKLRRIPWSQIDMIHTLGLYDDAFGGHPCHHTFSGIHPLPDWVPQMVRLRPLKLFSSFSEYLLSYLKRSPIVDFRYMRDVEHTKQLARQLVEWSHSGAPLHIRNLWLAGCPASATLEWPEEHPGYYLVNAPLSWLSPCGSDALLAGGVDKPYNPLGTRRRLSARKHFAKEKTFEEVYKESWHDRDRK